MEATPAGELSRGEHYHLRRAKVRGTVDLDDVQLLTARYVLGQLGYRVLVPLQVTGSAHEKVLVDLGWVPTDKIDDYLPTLDGKNLVVEGRVQMPAENDASVEPQGEHLGKPTWMRPNPKAVAQRVDGLEPDLYIVSGKEARGEQVDVNAYPIDGYTTPVRMAPSKHVEYAATWFAVAAVVLAAWIGLSLRRKEPREDPAPDQTSKL